MAKRNIRPTMASLGYLGIHSLFNVLSAATYSLPAKVYHTLCLHFFFLSSFPVLNRIKLS